MKLATFALAFLLGVNVWGAPSVTPAEAKSAIQKRYDEWSKAYMSMDVDQLVAILSPDYTLTDSTGRTTPMSVYSAYLKLRKSSGYKDPVKTSTRIRKLKLDVGEANVDAIETMVSVGVDPKTTRPAKCLHRHEYADVWRIADGVWRLAKTTTLRESTSYEDQ